MRRCHAVAVAVATALMLIPAAAGAQEPGSATVVPVQIPGPPSERLNLVVLGDGYTAAEQQKFRDQVDKHLNILWSIDPFRSYRSYINVYRIEIVSAESGISCDPDDGNVRRNTPLRLQYASTCPADPNARGITFGAGGTAALNGYVSMIPGVAPGNRQTLTLANTFTYGGIGGTDATTSGGSPQGPLITPHELGHSLGGLQDEYPYSTRGVPGGPYTGGEPSSIHHTIQTEAQMLASQTKWWRWLGEESLSGGRIGRYESGLSRSSGVWRPSQHSMMRWIGFYFDQVGRERMTQRISGRRGTNALSVVSPPTDQPVGPTDVLWVEVPHPAYHELEVAWRVNGEPVPDTNNSRNLDLGELDVEAGDTVQVTVRDPTDFVRDPAVRGSGAMTQTRQWTVGSTPSTPAPVPVAFTNSTPTNRAAGAGDVVYVETTHPVDRVLAVTWRLDGEVVPNPHNSRNFDLGARSLAPGTHALSATVTDPVGLGAESQTLTWTVDNTDPTAPATLSRPLATVAGDTPHNVYFERFTMGLEPQDDQPGYVVGEFQLNRDGWFNYFGWVDAPEGTPFLFTPRGTTIKALTYGNLGTGGLSKAPFEQEYPDFVPGYGTHIVEHRAIDAAGNIGPADEFRSTVLPGATPECTTTITGSRNSRLTVDRGVTCLQGATVNGRIEVRPGGSLVVSDSTIAGRLDARGAHVVQLFATDLLGSADIAGTTGDVTIAGSEFDGWIRLADNEAGAEGVILAGNRVRGGLDCAGAVTDFGAGNRVAGPKSGDCADLPAGVTMFTGR